MRLRSTFANGALFAATAAVVLTTAMAVPGVSSAQPYNETYADQCQQQQNSRAVAGAVLGGVAGAVLGSNLARGGGRTGGAAGAAAGAGIGASTTDCQADYPPPPPPGYDGGPNAYDNGPPPPGYANEPPPGYGQGPEDNCGPAQRLITFPDGSQERDTVQACQDDNGRWTLPPGS